MVEREVINDHIPPENLEEFKKEVLLVLTSADSVVDMEIKLAGIIGKFAEWKAWACFVTPADTKAPWWEKP